MVQALRPNTGAGDGTAKVRHTTYLFSHTCLPAYFSRYFFYVPPRFFTFLFFIPPFEVNWISQSPLTGKLREGNPNLRVISFS